MNGLSNLAHYWGEASQMNERRDGAKGKGNDLIRKTFWDWGCGHQYAWKLNEAF